MRTLGGLCLALVIAGGLFAQGRGGGGQPFMTGAPGNVVYPGGTSANNPFITRVTPNVVYPGGGGPRMVIPGTTPRVQRNWGSSYIYPMYYPNYDPSYGAPSDQSAAPAQQSSPNVIVIYPQQTAAPVVVPETAHPAMHVYQPETAEPAEAAGETTEHYLFAFKDHSIYSAVAYWVEGDTLHYFTNGHTHNQVSLSLLDRDLTERLNKESGTPLKLPPAK
jgi:hypothetical protein